MRDVLFQPEGMVPWSLRRTCEVVNIIREERVYY
jgi:hypothetical protein